MVFYLYTNDQHRNDRHILRNLMCLLAILLISGCTAFKPTSHPTTIKPVKHSFKENRPSKARYQVNKIQKNSINQNLNLLTKGRTLQLTNQCAQSQKAYAQVVNQIAQTRLQAKIQASDMLKNIEAILINDRVLPYHVSDYEMTFLYSYQALNYLVQKDLENALVSIRKLSNAQYWIYKQKVIKQKLQNENDNGPKLKAQVSAKQKLKNNQKIENMYQQTQDIANAYENGFSYYLASILYQAYDDNFNNARVAIKNAKRLLPENPYVQSTYNEIQQGIQSGQAFKSNNGRLVILYEQGFVSPKKPVSLTLYLGKLGLQRLSLPYYPDTAFNKASIQDIQIQALAQDKTYHHQTALLVKTTQMAAKSLTEAYPTIITKEIARLVAKAAVTYQATEKAGIWGNLLGSTYSYLSSRSDLRSWLLLPNNIQLFEASYQKGKYAININSQTYKINIKPQQTTLLWVIDLGNYNHHFKFQL